MLPILFLTSTRGKTRKAMAYKNQVPNLTPRGKAARRRSWAASAALFVVAAACIVLTGYIWMIR